MKRFKILEDLVISCYSMGPYDIVILQDPQGNLITIEIYDYEEE